MFAFIVSMINIALITLGAYLLLTFFNKETSAAKQRQLTLVITALVLVYAILKFLSGTILFN